MSVRALIAALALCGLAACAAAPRDLSAEAPAGEPSVARGEVLVKRHCSRCHATGPTGASRFPPAPPLRSLHERYEPETLAEGLAEGMLVGHPAMPEFRFGEADVRSVILYLESIQTRQRS